MSAVERTEVVEQTEVHFVPPFELEEVGEESTPILGEKAVSEIYSETSEATTPRYLSTSELSKVLGISPHSWAQHLKKRYNLPFRRMGGRAEFFAEEDVLALKEKREREKLDAQEERSNKRQAPEDFIGVSDIIDILGFSGRQRWHQIKGNYPHLRKCEIGGTTYYLESDIHKLAQVRQKDKERREFAASLRRAEPRAVGLPLRSRAVREVRKTPRIPKVEAQKPEAIVVQESKKHVREEAEGSRLPLTGGNQPEAIVVTSQQMRRTRRRAEKSPVRRRPTIERPKPPEGYISQSQVREILNLSESGWDRIKPAGLTPLRIGSRVFYPKEGILEVKEQREEKKRRVAERREQAAQNWSLREVSQMVAGGSLGGNGHEDIDLGDLEGSELVYPVRSDEESDEEGYEEAYKFEGEKLLGEFDASTFEDRDPVRQYLKEIGKTPLLTPEQEIVLTRRLKQVSVALAQAREAEFLSPEFLPPQLPSHEERQALVGKLEKEVAKLWDKLYESNLRLVVSVAKKYQGRGMELLDLIQEGNFGLIKAGEKFNPYKTKVTDGGPFKFSTYAIWWIRQAITRAIADQGRTIRLPVHMHETVNNYNRQKRSLTQELGREPTRKELGDKFGESGESAERAMSVSKPVSLDCPIGEDGEATLEDYVDSDGPGTEEQGLSLAMKDQIQEVLTALTPREKKVLELRYGLEDGRSRTLEEVGQEFNVTRERIRQIEAKALRKLRRPHNARKLVEARF